MLTEFANIILAGSAVYHLVMGAACVAGFRFIARATRSLYGLRLPEQLDPRLEYAIKPLGAFALWTGVLCALAFVHRDEAWVNGVRLALAGLFLLRAFFRWSDRDLFRRAFDVDWNRSRWNVAFNVGLALVLIAAVARGGLA